MRISDWSSDVCSSDLWRSPFHALMCWSRFRIKWIGSIPTSRAGRTACPCGSGPECKSKTQAPSARYSRGTDDHGSNRRLLKYCGFSLDGAKRVHDSDPQFITRLERREISQGQHTHIH